MLRRVVNHCTAPSALMHSAVTTSSPRLASSSDDQAELEREKKLREQFEKKMQPPAGGGSFFQRMTQPPPGMSWPQPGAGGWQQGAGGAGGQRRSFGDIMYGAFVYSLAFYLLVITYQMRKPQSVAMVVQGMPHFASPPEVTAAYLAVRILLPTAKQNELQAGFETFRQSYPQHNFYHYLCMMHPNVLAGRTTSQQELFAALVAVCTSQPDMKWTRVLSRVSRWGDDAARVDTVLDNIRREFPTQAQQAAAYRGGSVAA
jgi:hypothetical protein